MKKWIIIAFIVIATLVVAQRRSSSLHRIPSPTKIEGWLNVNGDVWPVIPDKWDLGKPANWWDSSFVSYPEFRNILIWSADSTDSAFVTPTKLVIDSVISGYFSTPVAIADTTYTNWLAVKDSSSITVLSPIIFNDTLTSAGVLYLSVPKITTGGILQVLDITEATYVWLSALRVNNNSYFGGAVVDSAVHDFLDNAWFRNGDSLFFVLGADTSSATQDGARWRFNSDNGYFFLSEGGNVADFQASGVTIYPTLVALGESHLGNASTDKVKILGDSIIYITDVCSTYWWQTADSSIIESNKPMRLGSGSIILSGDSCWTTDIYYKSGGGLSFGELGVYNNLGELPIGFVSTKVQYDSFNTDGLSNNTTPDEANEQLTIDHAGIYLVTVSIHASSVAGAGALFSFDIYKNNGATHLTNLHAHRNFVGGGGDVASVSISGLVALSASDDLELWVTNETNAQNIILNDVTLSVIQVGN